MLRYEGNNYFWVNDLNGILLGHPSLLDRIGPVRLVREAMP